MSFLIFALGLVTWTLIEYGMHHWNGHLMKGERTLAENTFGTMSKHITSLRSQTKSCWPRSSFHRLRCWGASYSRSELA